MVSPLLGTTDRILGGVSLGTMVLAGAGIAQLAQTALTSSGVAPALARQTPEAQQTWYSVATALCVLLALGVAARWDTPVALAGLLAMGLDSALSGPAVLQLFVQLTAMFVVIIAMAPVVTRLSFVLLWGWLGAWRWFVRA